MLTTPFARETLTQVRVGDDVGLSGIVYTARDVACARIASLLQRGEQAPIPLAGEAIYYAGPSFAADGTISALGPTTAMRLDPFLEPMLHAGVGATLGKGPRSAAAAALCARYEAIYLSLVGGAGSYLRRFVRSIELVAWPELGPEAVYRVEVENLPAVVAIDARGATLG